VVIGLIADLIAVNRALLEGIDWRIKRLEDTTLAGQDHDPAWSSRLGTARRAAGANRPDS
jgi:hypothetical protein